MEWLLVTLRDDRKIHARPACGRADMHTSERFEMILASVLPAPTTPTDCPIIVRGREGSGRKNGQKAGDFCGE
jgi:hypothetical protein